MNKLIPLFSPLNDHFIGKPDAPIEILSYGDFQCEHCGALYSVVKFLQEIFGRRLRYVFRHLPLQNLHILALDAAVATEVASLHNKFWQMHDLIFMNQKYLTRATISDFVEDLELDAVYFDCNSEYRKIARMVLINVESSIKGGINETPCLFINGVKYNGLCNFESLHKACINAGNSKEEESKSLERKAMGWLVQ